tara:strand:+ start:5281 stop:5538 length:258 start_codon:yes stop_codon:yes gene_type:complete
MSKPLSNNNIIEVQLIRDLIKKHLPRHLDVFNTLVKIADKNTNIVVDSGVCEYCQKMIDDKSHNFDIYSTDSNVSDDDYDLQLDI